MGSSLSDQKEIQAVSLFLTGAQYCLACLCGAKMAVHQVVDRACEY